MQKNYNEYTNRVILTQEVLNLPNIELMSVMLKFLVFLETGEHKDRQTTWAYLENCIEQTRQNFHGKIKSSQALTDRKNRAHLTLVEMALDKAKNLP